MLKTLMLPNNYMSLIAKLWLDKYLAKKSDLTSMKSQVPPF